MGSLLGPLCTLAPGRCTPTCSHSYQGILSRMLWQICPHNIQRCPPPAPLLSPCRAIPPLHRLLWSDGAHYDDDDDHHFSLDVVDHHCFPLRPPATHFPPSTLSLSIIFFFVQSWGPVTLGGVVSCTFFFVLSFSLPTPSFLSPHSPLHPLDHTWDVCAPHWQYPPPLDHTSLG